MERIFKFIKVCIIVMVCVISLGVGMKSKAATIGTVDGLKQISAGPNKVEISWDAVIGNNIHYKAELCEKENFTGGIMDNLGAENRGAVLPRETFSGLTAGKAYYVRVTAFAGADNSESQYTWGEPSGILEVVTAPESVKVPNFRQTKATETSITVSWKKCASANGYQLTYGKKGGDISSRKTVQLGKATSYTVQKLARNTEYDFWLCPVKKSASDYLAVAGFTTSLQGRSVLPTKIKGVGASFWSPTSEHLDLEWRQSNSADGYQYQIYAEDGNKALISGVKEGNGGGTYLSASKLKSLRFLKLRVRGYVEIAGDPQYGAWSEWLYFSRQPDVELKNTRKGIKLIWDRVSGAGNYSVYISTRRNAGYKKVQSTAKNTLTVKKFGKTKLKSGRQYYFMVVANKKVGKKTFQSTRNYCFWITYRKSVSNKQG